GLVQRGRSLRAVAPARAGMFGIAFVLADLERLAIDVGEQAARRLAVEAGRRHEHVAALDAPRPRARVELRPVVPPLARRKGGEIGPAGSWVSHASGT